MADMVKNKEILQMQHLSLDVALWRHGAIASNKKYINCSLNYKKLYKDTDTVRRMDNIQK